jgi:hypothetical protein
VVALSQERRHLGVVIADWSNRLGAMYRVGVFCDFVTSDKLVKSDHLIRSDNFQKQQFYDGVHRRLSDTCTDFR